MSHSNQITQLAPDHKLLMDGAWARRDVAKLHLRFIPGETWCGTKIPNTWQHRRPAGAPTFPVCKACIYQAQLERGK